MMMPSNQEEKDICVIGLGNLGLPLAISLALKGHAVTGVDNRKGWIKEIKYGDVGDKFPEPDFTNRLQSVIGRDKYLDITYNLEYGIMNNDYIFIIVGTPSNPDGSFSLDQVLSVCNEISDIWERNDMSGLFPQSIIISSTVSPGDTNGQIAQTLSRNGAIRGEDYYLAYWPEFVALGSTIDDFLNPEYVVVGTDNKQAEESMACLFNSMNYNTIAIPTSIPNAEMIKIGLNFAVSTKITLANYLGYLCEEIPFVDGKEVLRAIGSDSRIGSKYFSIGTSLGGPCFPRDVRAMSYIEHSHLSESTRLLMAQYIGNVDSWYDGFMLEFVEVLESETKGGPVGIIGYSFKSGTTCDISFGKEIAGTFDNIYIYDPLHFHNTLDQVMMDCSLLVITRPYKEHELPDFYSLLRPHHIIFDPWRCLDEKKIVQSGAKYETTGRHPTLSYKEDRPFFAGKYCLVTGGTGMIGRQVCSLLASQGARVSSVSLELPDEDSTIPGVDYYLADLTNSQSCISYITQEYVFHVAGIKGNPGVSLTRLESFYNNLLTMNANVIHAAVRNNVPNFVYVSSIGAYPPDCPAYDETITGYPMDLPGLAKLAGEEMVRAHIKSTGANWSIVRPSNVYGPGDNFDPETAMVVPSLIAKAHKAQSENGTLKVWGDGSPIRDFVYSEDVARGIILAGQYGMDKYPFVNLGGPLEYTIADLVRLIRQNFECGVEYNHDGATGFPRRVLDSTLAKHLWSWEPLTYLEDGIRVTSDWYKIHGQEPNRFNPLKG